MLIENPAGNYSFVRGISPYSGGAVAAPGHELEFVRFEKPVALRQGFEAISQHLEKAGRPKAALCSIALRSPKPFTFQGFSDFNAGYVGVLKEWGLLRDGLNPVARTNIAPELGAPAEPSLYSFAYTVNGGSGRSFIVAGAGELPEGTLDPHNVVRRGETSPAALEEKARFVMGLMEGRMKDLKTGWDRATVTNIYTVHNIYPFLAEQVARRMGAGAMHGMTWHYSRPPIVSIEYEMDVRGCAREITI